MTVKFSPRIDHLITIQPSYGFADRLADCLETVLNLFLVGKLFEVRQFVQSIRNSYGEPELAHKAQAAVDLCNTITSENHEVARKLEAFNDLRALAPKNNFSLRRLGTETMLPLTVLLLVDGRRLGTVELKCGADLNAYFACACGPLFQLAAFSPDDVWREASWSCTVEKDVYVAYEKAVKARDPERWQGQPESRENL